MLRVGVKIKYWLKTYRDRSYDSNLMRCGGELLSRSPGLPGSVVYDNGTSSALAIRARVVHEIRDNDSPVQSRVQTSNLTSSIQQDLLPVGEHAC